VGVHLLFADAVVLVVAAVIAVAAGVGVAVVVDGLAALSRERED